MNGTIGRDIPMRILWVKVGGLWPLNTGGRLRSFNTIAQLSRQHRVAVFTTHEPGEDSGELAAQLADCETVKSIEFSPTRWRNPVFAISYARSILAGLPVDVSKYRVPALRRAVAHALATGKYDLCVCDFIFAAPNVPFNLGIPVVFFAHNVESLILERLASTVNMPAIKALLAVEAGRMKRYETTICRAARLSIAVSPQDRDMFRAYVPEAESRIVAVPTGVDTAYFRPANGAESPRELVFSDSMDWKPNEDAVLYFMTDILPAIRSEIPDTGFTVVGRNPGNRLRQLAARNGVRVTGTVRDVRPYINTAAVYVVPLRVGGGTRLKVFEALSMGKAMVASSLAVEGLPLIEGTHYLRADEPRAFASKVVELLRSREARRALGTAGSLLTRRNYSWPAVAQQFSDHCKSALE